MDLTFILLITFIITFPLIEQWIPVNLPKGNANNTTPSKAQTISMDQHACIYLDNFKVSLKELQKRITEIRKLDPEIAVMVRADERVRYGEVVKVLKILHNAEITKVALVTQEEKKSQP